MKYLNKNLRKFSLAITLIVLPLAWVFSQSLNRIQGELLLQMESPQTAAEVHETIKTPFQNQNFDISPILPTINVWKVSFDHNLLNENRIIQSLNTQANIQYCQFNYLVSDRSEFNDLDPFFAHQWYLKNDGSSGGIEGVDLSAEAAWSFNPGGLSPNGDTIVICVIDNEFDTSHEDLQNRFWINHDEIPGNYIDDDGNGFIDDYNGWNVVLQNDELSGANSEMNHATAISGIIAAERSNGLGIAGILKNSKIMPVVRGESLDEVLIGYSYPLEMRKRYNESNGEEGALVVATSTSWGVGLVFGYESPIWCSMYDLLGQEGILNAAATLNNPVDVDLVGDMPTTCTSDYLVTVTSLDKKDELVHNAAFGSQSIDIGAFGEDIFTTMANQEYGFFNGTSFATPQVAAAIGMIYSSNCEDLSELAISDPASAALLVKDFLYYGLVPNNELQGITTTGGRLDLANPISLVEEACNESECFPPFAIHTEEDAENNFTISWWTPEGIDDLSFYYRVAGQLQWTTISNVSNEVELTNLAVCAEYEFTIQYSCGGLQIDNNQIRSFYTSGCCTAPSTMSVVDLNAERISIIWEDTAPIFGYTVRYRQVGNEVWSMLQQLDNDILLGNLLACTTFEVQVRSECSIGESTEFSSSYFFSTLDCGNCVELDYCVPMTNLSSTHNWISSVNLNGIQNSSNNENGLYSDFSGQSANIHIGQSYTLQITSESQFLNIIPHFQVWIDLDQNGSFAPNEIVFQEVVEDGNFEGILQLDENVLLGNSRMRISLSDQFHGPCQDEIVTGEIEDYCINILSDVSCITPFAILSELQEDSIVLSWLGGVSAESYFVSIREVTQSDWTTIETSASHISFNELFSCTDYELKLQSECNGNFSDFSASYYFTTPGCGACFENEYCVPTGINNSFEWIGEIMINDVLFETNTSSGYANSNYNSINLVRGEYNSLTLTNEFANSTFDEYFSIWIDLNQDGYFDDITELYYLGTCGNADFLFTLVFLNDTTMLGSTKMRIGMKYNDYMLNPCEDNFFGEVEDYCVNIIESNSIPCATPSIGTMQSESSGTIDLDWNPNSSDEVTYQILYKNTLHSDWTVINTQRTDLQLTGLNDCQEYSFKIRSLCENGFSQFSGPTNIIVNCPTSINEQNQIVDVFSVYPNPMVNELILSSKNKELQNISIDIFNSHGELIRRIKEVQLREKTALPYLSQFTSGIYFLKIQSKTSLQIIKLVKI